ncbi:hypothetical protein [Streptomyces sp. NPDC048638]|uniref:hypothetical protein n=1 Tax=Streptomyces sp. NPDC048638 TaxID=3365580 RepID=UPI0037224D08
MAGSTDRPARIRVNAVVIIGVVAFAAALVANSAHQAAGTWAGIAVVAACTAWLAWDEWRRRQTERTNRPGGAAQQ